MHEIMQFQCKNFLYIDTGNKNTRSQEKMIGSLIPYYMMNNQVLPWSAALGNMNDFTYFNAPNTWLQMQMFNPFVTMPTMGDGMLMQNAYMQGFQLAEKINFNSNVSQTMQEISRFKQELTTILAQKDLPADKKQKLEEIKELLEETEKKMKDFASRANAQDMNTSKEQLAEIKEELKSLKQAATLAVKPEEAAQDAETENENTQPSENNESSNTQQTTTNNNSNPAQHSNSTTNNQTNPSENTQPAVEGPTEAEQQAYKKALEICKDIYVAIDGPGTDCEKLDTAIMSINKDNVIFVMDKWLLDYQQKTGDDSLMETIYDDIFSGDDRKKYTEHILNALKEKADELGIDISPEQAVVESQLSRWWRNDGAIYNAMMDIHAKLTNIPLVDEAGEEAA